MIIEDEQYLDFSDVLIKPKWTSVSSRSRVDVHRRFKNPSYECVPIMAANMDHVGTVEMLLALSKSDCLTVFHKHYTIDQLCHIFQTYPQAPYSGWVTIGQSRSDLEKLRALVKNLEHLIPNICIDVANGQTESFVSWVQDIRTEFPNNRIMAGNVASPEMTQQLIRNGADIVKVGIGNGSTCITRTQTGVGVPQLSAIIKCADSAHGLGGLVCADGGCSSPGDVMKAFGAGADFVMLGGMLAGHDQCDGEYVYSDGSHRSIKIPDDTPVGMHFYGMASSTAQNKYTAGVPDYATPEGKDVIVPYRGNVEDTISNILGGLRSGMSMIGAKNIKDVSKCTTFIRVNNQVNNIFSGSEIKP